MGAAVVGSRQSSKSLLSSCAPKPLPIGQIENNIDRSCACRRTFYGNEHAPVSQIVSFTFFRSTVMTLTLKSTPASARRVSRRGSACSLACAEDSRKPSEGRRSCAAASGAKGAQPTNRRRHLLEEVIRETEQDARFADAAVAD